MDAEIGLLRELAGGKKTFQQVAIDASRFRFRGRHLKRYVQDSSNASRNIQKRLKELTGVSSASLHYADVRHKNFENNTGAAYALRNHPFNLVSTTMQRLLQRNPDYFHLDSTGFMATPEYLEYV